MATQLNVSVGQYSDKGIKPINQDFHGVMIPEDDLKVTKGIVVALADGISSSSVSQDASQSTVMTLLQDYYCTSQAWTVKTSATKVLYAINTWLHGQTSRSQYRTDFNKGFVCTLSALIFKSTTAHLFHVGDCRVYRLRGNQLELLTQDHRVTFSGSESYLSRAMGVHTYLDLDYQSHSLECQDIFLLMTDGVYEFVNVQFIKQTINDNQQDLNKAAQLLVEQAKVNQSDDNLTAQIVRIDELPKQSEAELKQSLTALPFAPSLSKGDLLDQWRILRPLYVSPRSHVFLACHDEQPDYEVAIKIPSVEQQEDIEFLERFTMEDWAARRIDSPYVVKSPTQDKKSYLYSVMEYVEGCTLTQWMKDHPSPDLESVRKIIEQVAKGLQAFHRKEMLHQDIRPENILIDGHGHVTIVDFGSVKISGIAEIESPLVRMETLGTAQYMAPEYFMGYIGTNASDIFSLGVLTYHMLSGQLPYGSEIARCTSQAAQAKLKYRSVLDDKRDIPVWVDSILKRAVHIRSHMRYQELSEFVYDLRHPSERMLIQAKGPLIERNPIAVWQGIAGILFLAVIYLISQLYF